MRPSPGHRLNCTKSVRVTRPGTASARHVPAARTWHAACWCSDALRSKMEKRNVDFAHSAHRSGPAAGRRSARLALQLGMGLLAERRARPGSTDTDRPVADGSHLRLRSRVAPKPTLVVSHRPGRNARGRCSTETRSHADIRFRRNPRQREPKCDKSATAIEMPAAGPKPSRLHRASFALRRAGFAPQTMLQRHLSA